jgi:hypothetical protein
MLTQDAINFFQGNRSALARALGIEPESTYSWGARVPRLRQLQLEAITGGVLKADPDIFKPAPKRQPAQ